MKRVSALFVMLLLCADLSAAIFGGEPYEVFDQGGVSYIVMGNSLIDDQVTLFDEGDNRQGDTCLLEGSSTIEYMFPPDAIIAKAYLIWMGAVDPEKMDQPTDNAVHLKFIHEDGGYTYEEDIVAGDAPKIIGDTGDPFEFETLAYTAEINTGCTETDPGTVGTAEIAYFTYRVDITSFFDKLFDDNRAATTPVTDGDALQGQYTVSGLDCTDHDNYKCRTLMVSNWSILVIYRSGTFSHKKVFLYPGFSRLRGETATTTLSGLDLQKSPEMNLTMVTAEGDTPLFNLMMPPEMLYLRGHGSSNYPLAGNCGENAADPVEIWDSRKSYTIWDAEAGEHCISSSSTASFSLDVDTFYLNATVDPLLSAQFAEGDTSFDLIVSTNQDDILTNYLVLAVDVKESNFDIPGENELLNCVCFPEENDIYCPGQPQYIMISIENWGQAAAELVYLESSYGNNNLMDYIPGTTEVATQFDEEGNGTNWQKILDGPEDKFPLSEPNLIANRLDSFMLSPEIATSYLVRFRLLPKTGFPPIEISRVSATISDDQSSYNTNTNIPLKLFPGECTKTCTLEELKKLCGGLSPDDPDVFDPTPDDDAIAGSDDELTDETPDATVDETPEDDPDSTHPMDNQDPGCSLSVI